VYILEAINPLQEKCYKAFGSIVDFKTDIMYYELKELSLNSILDYAKNCDFDIKEFSYENKPDFVNGLSYPEGLIWVYNPNDANGSFEDVEYTRKWRYIHELCHGLTYNYILDKFDINTVTRGEGVVSYDNAVIALTWEIETMILQFKTLEDMGVYIETFDKNREINTLFADLVYRCLTGDFTNPDLSGFLADNKPLGDWKKTLKDLYISEGIL